MNEYIDNLVFDRTQADLDKLTKKAYIDYQDLIRVESAVKWISYILNVKGYRNVTKNRLDWNMNDFRTDVDMERLRNNILTVREAYYTPDSTPLTPDRITYTSIYQANAIEKILYDLGTLAEKIEPGHHHLAFRLGTRPLGNRSEAL